MEKLNSLLLLTWRRISQLPSSFSLYLFLSFSCSLLSVPNLSLHIHCHLHSFGLPRCCRRRRSFPFHATTPWALSSFLKTHSQRWLSSVFQSQMITIIPQFFENVSIFFSDLDSFFHGQFIPSPISLSSLFVFAPYMFVVYNNSSLARNLKK